MTLSLVGGGLYLGFVCALPMVMNLLFSLTAYCVILSRLNFPLQEQCCVYTCEISGKGLQLFPSLVIVEMLYTEQVVVLLCFLPPDLHFEQCITYPRGEGAVTLG